MKKVLRWLIVIWIRFIDSIVAVFSKEPVRKMMEVICPAISSRTDYAAFQINPKNTVDIPLPSRLNKEQNIAIVLQGPICMNDDMTLNSVIFYQKIYPYAKIILSTWIDEPEDVLKKFTDMGVVVVLSQKPLNNGTINVNYQIVNSLAGIKKAKELGCTFAVKTRTDQRVCKPYIFNAMLAALHFFPGQGEQRGRLVALGITGGGMWMPYFMSDFLYLGYTDDLIRFFSAPLDDRILDDDTRTRLYAMTRRKNVEQMLSPEIYLFKHYCEDILGYRCQPSVEQYWEIVKHHVICFGMKDVDLMWNKYQALYDLNACSGAYYGKADSEDRLATMNFDFFNWLNLYMGNTVYDKSYEKYTDVEVIAGYAERHH